MGDEMAIKTEPDWTEEEPPVRDAMQSVMLEPQQAVVTKLETDEDSQLEPVELQCIKMEPFQVEDHKPDKDHTHVKNEIAIEEHAVEPASCVEEEERLSPVAAAVRRYSSSSGDSLSSDDGEAVTASQAEGNMEWPKCDVCGKIFARNSTLSAHMRTHNGERPYQCDVCGEKFFEWGSELLPHLRTHSSEAGGTFRCPECGKSYSSSNSLNSHRRTHLSDDQDPFSTGNGRRLAARPHKCDLCGNVFARRYFLSRHVKLTHEGERPFTCDLCGRKFTQNGHLAAHLRRHSGHRPHKCHCCEMTFSQKTDLTKHERIHSGAQPYQCDVCGRTFSQTSNLSRHLRSHTGIQPFKCDICNKTYSHKKNLSKHINTH